MKLFFSYGIIFSNDMFIVSDNKILNINNNNDLLNMKVIEEIYQLCEQLLNLALEGNNIK